MSFTTSAMPPSLRRTATAQVDGLRIITPSRTACPPIVFTAVSYSAPAGAGLLQPPLEALHPAAAVDELLLARVERVAGGADLHVELRLRRARRELVPAGAGHVRDDVFGMDVRLHDRARIAAAVSAATLPPETTTATKRGSIRPDSRGASAVAAAGSHASFAREYSQRNASSISVSETSTLSTPSSRRTSIAASAVYGVTRPSAIDTGVTATGWPA